MRRREKDMITWIRPQRGWSFVNVRELIQYRDLLMLLSLRGIKTKYAQSVIGVGWAIVQPVVTTLVFTIIFGRLAKISSDGTPYFLFSLVGMVPWNYFSRTLNESSNSLITNSNMISKVYFPRVILPLSSSISRLIDFVIGFILMIALLLIYGYNPDWTIIFLPVLLLILLMTSLGLGMILSSMAVQYRDVKHAMTFMMQLLMYAAPVVYPTSSVPKEYQFFYAMNPMVGVIEGFRSIFLHTQHFPTGWALQGLLISLLLFIFGSIYFTRMESKFADVA